MEVAATEFEVQGLELDWVGLCWGNDLSLDSTGNWVFGRLSGEKWQRVKTAQKQQYILNKYRVLLTRARQGMVIWIPQGIPDKYKTLDPSSFDGVYEYVKACGVPEVHGVL